MSRARIIASVVLILLIAGTVMFIFLNSAEAPDISNAKSDKVVEVIEEKLPAVKDTVVALAGDKESVFSSLVRKSAHFIEFLILGCELAVLVILLRLGILERIAVTEFTVLLVAVFDEYIQSFVGRTDSINDVLLDFFGATVGVLITLLIGFVSSKSVRH